LVPEGPVQAEHVPLRHRPLVAPSEHAEPAGLHAGAASVAASEEPLSDPPELLPLELLLELSSPPLLPASDPPSPLPPELEASALESPPELLASLLESLLESLPPMAPSEPASPLDVPASEPLPELEELLLEELEPLLPPESSPPLLTPIASSPPSMPFGVVPDPPPHPVVFATTAQPARALYASQLLKQLNLRMGNPPEVERTPRADDCQFGS
jgi:hypothetical protein